MDDGMSYMSIGSEGKSQSFNDVDSKILNDNKHSLAISLIATLGTFMSYGVHKALETNPDILPLLGSLNESLELFQRTNDPSKFLTVFMGILSISSLIPIAKDTGVFDDMKDNVQAFITQINGEASEFES